MSDIHPYHNVSAKCIGFNGSYGTREVQLNRILEEQQDAPNKFWITQIIPIDDRGNDYFWFFYHIISPNTIL